MQTSMALVSPHKCGTTPHTHLDDHVCLLQLCDVGLQRRLVRLKRHDLGLKLRDRGKGEGDARSAR